MNHKQILNLLLSKPGVRVIEKDTRAHVVYRLEHDKLVSYHYDITNTWVRDITVHPLNIFTDEHYHYSQAPRLTLEGEYTNIPPASTTYISDKKVIELLLDYKPIKILVDNEICIARLQQEDDVIAFFTEEQYRHRMLLDYVYECNERATGHTPNADIKHLLQGKTVLMIEKFFRKLTAVAYQFEGDYLVKYELSKKKWTWCPVVTNIIPFFNFNNQYSKVIDRITTPNDLPKETTYSLTHRQILSLYVKANVLYFIDPEGLIRIKNGSVDYYENIHLCTSDTIEVLSDIGISSKSLYEQLQYRLLFEHNIDIFSINEQRFLDGINYFFYDDEIRFIFNHHHGIQHCEKLSIAKMSKQLSIPAYRVDRMLKSFHRRLRHPKNYEILLRGYVNIPGDFTIDYIAVPDKPQHLSIDKMRYVAGCIANIY